MSETATPARPRPARTIQNSIDKRQAKILSLIALAEQERQLLLKEKLELLGVRGEPEAVPAPKARREKAHAANGSE